MKIEDIIQEKLRTIFRDDSILYDKTRFVGGLTNYNYIMEIGGREYVIRQPGGMTDLMIDRHIEKVNNQVVSGLGLNSDCIYFDEFTGIKVSVHIPNSKNVALTDPCAPSNLTAVARLMKKIHTIQIPFSNTFDWIKELEKYENLVRMLKGDFFYDYMELKEKLVKFVQDSIADIVLAPCHNDTVPENFVTDDQGKAYLIDWEYAGMNDPIWDLAAYIVEARLPEDAMAYLMQAYFGKQASEEEERRIKCYILMQDLLWTVWAQIRHYNGDDFLDYCNFRYERFRKNMQEILLSSDYAIAEMVKNTI